MYVVSNLEKQKVPIKVWLHEGEIEDSCLEQAYHLSQLPFIHKWVSLMLRKHNKKDVAEECRFSYKDIDAVINNELDLITPVKELFTLGVVKG
jgi:tRNA-splicing ligase RtcB (3'-phosphate/5'-hydroxy nucleic acid ligase)